MKTIIFDSDNTIGIPGRPMDDALALFYLLGNKDKAKIIGITATHGNGTVKEVVPCFEKTLADLKLEHINLLTGAEQGADPVSSAARYIAKTVNEHPGEITFLGLGALTNLYEASLLDPEIYHKFKEIVLMGGKTETILFHGNPMDELNFTVDHVAAASVLSSGANISVITGNNCLPVAALPKDEFTARLSAEDNPSGLYVLNECGYRFKDKKEIYGAESSYAWDAVAASYVLHPEFFEDDVRNCYINVEDMKTGFLNPVADGPHKINMPVVKDVNAFREDLYESWRMLEV